MGGPWFTVQESGTDWEPVGTLWISNGREHEAASLELRVRFDGE